LPALVGIPVKKRDYILEFNKMRFGANTLEFSLQDAFLEYMGSSVRGVDAIATAEVIKTDSMYQVTVTLNGKAEVTCDRCLDEFECPVSGSYLLILKISEVEQFDDDEIVYITPATFEYDLSQFLYDCLMLSIPLKKECSLGKKACNPEVISRLMHTGEDENEEETNVDKPEADPRWEKLRNMIEPED
jgi:uncharacterized metal-binding protein YceD (DUF177 family)